LDCDLTDIYCLCKFHPKYRDCVCLSYPKSVICSPFFCQEHENSYECNPQYCDCEDNKNKPECFCKTNTNHITCKCKLNPFHKDCFCMKFPLSHICNDRICKFNPNLIYCKCQLNPGDPICSPKFCTENPTAPQCECLTKPLSTNCKCINQPNTCTQQQIMDSIVNYDKRIRGTCAGAVGRADKKIILNAYYPPCIYGTKDDKAKGKAKNYPCLPYPGAPKPCDKNSKEPCLDKVNKTPCIKNPKKHFIHKSGIIGRNSFAYNMVSQNHLKSGKFASSLLSKGANCLNGENAGSSSESSSSSSSSASSSSSSSSSSGSSSSSSGVNLLEKSIKMSKIK